MKIDWNEWTYVMVNSFSIVMEGRKKKIEVNKKGDNY